MTDEQINAAIAEACGDYICECCKDICKDCDRNYCTDLNAMHEAEKVLTPKNWDRFSEKWWNYCKYLRSDDADKAIHATARQRAEAFLRTLGKWEEGK
jgi:hypothetical protein